MMSLKLAGITFIHPLQKKNLRKSMRQRTPAWVPQTKQQRKRGLDGASFARGRKFEVWQRCPNPPCTFSVQPTRHEFRAEIVEKTGATLYTGAVKGVQFPRSFFNASRTAAARDGVSITKL